MFDLSNDGVGYSTSGGYLDDVVSQLDEIKAKIVAGEIEVPSMP
jgi:basic membrane protein A